MAIMKVIEVLAQSPNSWEEAAQLAVAEATQTLHGVQSVFIQHFMAEVEGNRIVNYRVNAKITFRVDGSRSGTSGAGASKTASKTGASKTAGKTSAGKTAAGKAGGRR
jgi:flavin-binding protein dodecin